MARLKSLLLRPLDGGAANADGPGGSVGPLSATAFQKHIDQIDASLAARRPIRVMSHGMIALLMFGGLFTGDASLAGLIWLLRSFS